VLSRGGMAGIIRPRELTEQRRAMAKSVYFEIIELPKAFVIELRLPMDVDIASFNEIHTRLLDEWSIPARRHVVVDLTPTHYFGSVLLGLLINIRQRTRAGRGEMIICGASPTLVRVFRTANLERLMEMMPTRQEALDSL
jgi:anti-anti-sigma factor